MSLEQSIDRLAAVLERIVALEEHRPANTFKPALDEGGPSMGARATRIAAHIDAALGGEAQAVESTLIVPDAPTPGALVPCDADGVPTPKRRGRPPKVKAELPLAAPVSSATTRTPLTQDQTKGLIEAFTALGQSKGGGREAIATVLKEFNVSTVVAITGENVDAAIARAKALTK